MKNLNDYINNMYVSLEGLDEMVQEKIKNLDGYKINECCCGCDCDCDCGCTCCDEPKCSDNTCDVKLDTLTKAPTNQFGRFNSEYEIVNELDTAPKVNTLYDIHSQFNKYTFVNDVHDGHIEPLYFGQKVTTCSVEPVCRQNGDMPQGEANPGAIEQLYDVATCQNKKIYKFVKDMIEKFEFKCPIVQTKINGEVQVYVVKHSGSNGQENSIKKSLIEVVQILNALEVRSEVQWAQVLDVSIDNIDDLYGFVITFVLDPEKVRQTINKEKI